MIQAVDPSLIQFLYVAAFYAFLTFLVGWLKYPPGQQAAAVGLRLLGRFMVARFSDSPGTWHFPGFPQPAPDPKDPNAASQGEGLDMASKKGGPVGLSSDKAASPLGSTAPLGDLVVLVLMSGAAFIACLATQANHAVHDMHSLVTQARQQQEAKCTPPTPQAGVVPSKPAVCDKLLDCIEHAKTAATVCTGVEREMVDGGQASDGDGCTNAQKAAVASCALVGIAPLQNPIPDAAVPSVARTTPAHPVGDAAVPLPAHPVVDAAVPRDALVHPTEGGSG